MKSQTQSTSQRQGFTLVEVVITVILIVVVMVPLTRLSFTVMRATQYARDVGEALAVGQTQLESFGEMEFESIQSGSETQGKYDLTWTVSTVDDNKLVALEIAWTILGQGVDIDLNTVFSPPTDTPFNLP